MSAPSRRGREIALGALFLVAAAMLGFMATRMGSLSGFGDVIEVSVRFDNASGLVEDASVKIAGVEIGKVTSLNVDFDAAMATLKLKRSAQVRKDAVAAVRARSLLGEKYVDIQPVSRDAPLAEDGDSLTTEKNGLGIEELAAYLGPTIDEMELGQLSQGAQRVMAMVERQEEPIGQVLERINALLTRVEGLPFDDPAVVADVRQSLELLRQTAERLPSLTQEAEATLASARGLTESLEPTVRRVNESAEDLPALLASTQEALARVNRVMAILEPQAARLDELSYAMVRYLFRNEGLLVRLVPRDVEQFDPGFDWDDPPRNFSPAAPADPLLVPADPEATPRDTRPMSQRDAN